MRRTFAPPVLCLLAGLLPLPLAATAQADVRSGSVQDGVDSQWSAPSLDGPPPVVSEITEVRVDYDRQAGAVRVSASFNMDRRGTVGVSLVGQRTCFDEETADESVPRLSIELAAAPADEPETCPSRPSTSSAGSTRPVNPTCRSRASRRREDLGRKGSR